MNLDQVLAALAQRTITPEEAEALLQELQEPGGSRPGGRHDAGVPRGASHHFRGDEFFLANHVVNGQRVLPGVVYLELARAATNATCLKNVVWSRPFVANDVPAPLHVILGEEEAGAIAYEIASDEVHSQGMAILESPSPVAPVNVSALRARCEGEPLSRMQIYGSFRGTGVDYGAAHRSLDSVRTGVDGEGRRFVFAEVSLPQTIAATANDYVLHPSIMDAALQAPIGFLLGNAAMKPAVPFALGELRILAPCPTQAIVIVREAAGTSERVRKLHIDICDRDGNVCIRFEDFSARVLEPRQPAGVMLLAPRSDTARAAAPSGAWPEAHPAWVVLCEIDADLPGINTVRLRATGDIAQRFEAHAVALLQLIQQILRDKPKGEVLLQLVIPADGDGWLFSALSGLLKTAQLETPKLIAQTIGIDTTAGLAQTLRENGSHRGDAMIRHQRGMRSVTRFQEIGHAD